MYVCICRQITDSQIRDVCREGTSCLSELRDKLGVASQCGKCRQHASTIVNEFAATTPFLNAAPA